MAVAAARRGYQAEVMSTRHGPYFVQVRKGAQRKDVMEEAQRIFAAPGEGTRGDRPSFSRSTLNISLRLSTAEQWRSSSSVPTALYGDRTPHWIVAYEHDSDYIFAPTLGSAGICVRHRPEGRHRDPAA